MRTKAEAQTRVDALPLLLPVRVLDPGDPDPVDQPAVDPGLRPGPGRRAFRYVRTVGRDLYITTIETADDPSDIDLETLANNLPLNEKDRQAALDSFKTARTR